MLKKKIHVWEKHEIVLEAETSHANPYMDVDVGVRLRGPGGFDKRVWASGTEVRPGGCA